LQIDKRKEDLKMTKEREKKLLEKIRRDEIKYEDFQEVEDFLFIFDNGYNFSEELVGDIISDFAKVEGEIVSEEIIDKRRWFIDKEVVIKFKDRYFAFIVSEGATEEQENEYSDEIIEVIPKEVVIKKIIYEEKK